MKTYYLIISALIILIPKVSTAQVSQEWARTFNGSENNNDESVAIVYDGQGNIIVTGRVLSTGHNNDICTIKYSSSGAQIWAVTYNGTGNGTEVAAGLAADASGNVYITGQTRNSSLNYDIVLIKYNSSGVEQWVRTWAGNANRDDVPNDIAADAQGNTYITGYTEVTSSNTNYITLKYNTSGVLQWAKEYNNPINSYDAAYFIKTDLNGNVFVTGTSIAQTTGSVFLTIKYDSNGDSLWTASYNGKPQGFTVDQNGNVYVTGFTGSSINIDFATIKYNSNGVQQWAAIYDSSGHQDIPEDVEVDNAGNVYVTGSTRPNGSYNDIATIKYNSSGVRQWLAIYDNPIESLDDHGNDLILDNSGNVYVAGYTNLGTAGEDALTLKYNNSGVLQWVAQYDASVDDEANAIALDDNGNVYITGFQNLNNADFLTIKYSQSVGIHLISSEVPEQFSLSQNYPNPFNPVTKLEFAISNLGFVSLRVYDIQGREVATLVNENLAAGKYITEFKGADFPSGTYFYKLEAGRFTQTKSMILLK